MGLSHQRIAINATTVVQVSSTSDSSATSYSIQIQNLGNHPVYIGGEGLTSTSYGLSVASGAAVSIDNLAPNSEIYALSATGDSYVGVLRVVR